MWIYVRNVPYVELAELPPIKRGETLLSLWDQLEKLFGKQVDLLSNPDIRNPYFKASFEQSKTLIYDRKSKKIVI
jgi:hypothetical protein